MCSSSSWQMRELPRRMPRYAQEITRHLTESRRVPQSPGPLPQRKKECSFDLRRVIQIMLRSGDSVESWYVIVRADRGCCDENSTWWPGCIFHSLNTTSCASAMLVTLSHAVPSCRALPDVCSCRPNVCNVFEGKEEHAD